MSLNLVDACTASQRSIREEARTTGKRIGKVDCQNPGMADWNYGDTIKQKFQGFSFDKAKITGCKDEMKLHSSE